MCIEFSLPIYFIDRKNKSVLVGLNWYRNAHYYKQNAVKQYYHQLVNYSVIGFQGKLEKFSTRYKLFYKTSRSDPSNIIAIIEKFTLDSLQERNILVSDSVKHHIESSWSVGAQDKKNPRCEIIISPFL